MTEKNLFFDYTFTIHSWVAGGYFPDGHYSFPFSFVFPLKLPPSFLKTWSAHGLPVFGKVHYFLRSGFRKKDSRQMLFQDLPVVLTAKKPPSSEKLFGLRFDKKVSGYCSNHGNYYLKVEVSENSLALGQVAELLISVSTFNATTPIKFIECVLEMTTQVQAKGRNHKWIMKQERCVLPGIPIRVVRVGKDALHSKLQIRLREPLTGSLKTKNISNQFVLKAVGKIDGVVCCDSHPFSQVPVFVTSQKVEEVPVLQDPPNWNPKVFDVVNCEFTSRTRTTQDFKNSLPQGVELPKNVED